MADNKLDIKAFLDKDEQKDLLRLLTAGSVDDGKSTLIGRLLFDSKKLYEDQLDALERDSKRVGNAGEHIDYALLLDGLKAEREQGITIDVAYRYFSTNGRKFIIADTPGHEQYTRNMITGGSTANLAIILVDARTGVITQTRRHTFLVSLLGIKHVVLAVNKMDLVDFSEECFNEIVAEYKKFVSPLGIPDVNCIPLSALDGDNAKKYGWNLIVESNMEAFHAGVGPFTHGSKVHTDLMKTQALLHALDKYKFDAAFGGARRDEEKSRAKERIFSFRDKFHQWDPKNQRPELWDIYNARVHKGESIRVFPLSNWTELDIWQYIRLENIPIVPLYYAKERPVVQMDGNLIMADDDRLPEKYRDRIEMKMVRFRTLGCWPLTGAVESGAATIEEIVEEMMTTTKSERTTRVIDFDQDASMEQKKREGYF